MSNETEPRSNVSQVSSDALALLVPDGNISRIRMSFNPSTPTGAIKLVMATLSECPMLEEKSKEKLSLTDYIIHPASSTGDTPGEVQEFDRIVVFDNDGKAYACGSIGVKKSIAVMELIRGKAPWQPPFVVTVKTRRLGNGNNWMTLEPDMELLAKHLSGKK